MIENVDDPTEIKRYRDVVEISQSMFAGNYDDLRNNRKIETESFMMAATFTRTKIKREDLPEGDEINMCEAMDRVLALLQDTCRRTGRTVIVITHNTALTAMADRIIQVRSGKIVSNQVNEHPVPVQEIEW